MSTYTISGFAEYLVDTSTNTQLAFQGTTSQAFTFDDNEGDATFETDDVVATLGPSSFPLTYLGKMNVDLVGGGTMELALILGGQSEGLTPPVIEVLIVVPANKSISDFIFPNPIDYDSRSTEPFTVCFAQGTAIATPRGETAVEDLSIGDLVLTQTGDAVPVLWIGRQTIMPFFAGEASGLIRIAPDALGSGLPRRELRVTPDHGVYVDGLLVNAGALVNGSTIADVPRSELGERFTIYHIETENHDIVLAEGTPTETYVDYIGRQTFDNYAEYVDLYGAERTIPEMPAPRISSARLVPETIRSRLAPKPGVADGWKQTA